MTPELYELPTAQVQPDFNTLDVAPGTRTDYLARVPSFVAFVEQEGLHVNTFLHYKQYLAEREDVGVSTKNKHLVVAKAYLKELHRLGLLPVDITAGVKSFSRGKKHKKTGLNEDEVNRLCEWLRELDPHEPRTIRMKALVGLLLYQGMRQVEVCRLNASDYDPENRLLYVQGKGKDDKEVVHLHPEADAALFNYIREFHSTESAQEPYNTPMFASISNSSKGHRLTPRGLRSVITPVFEELGIRKSVHGLRHFFSTLLIKEYKGDLLQVARYTRHNSLEMLQVYFDDVNDEADLPRYYRAFGGIKLE